MPKSRDEYTRANREAWNEAAARHAAQNNARLFEDCKAPDFNALDESLLEALLAAGVEGRDVIQLCCNNARETLSLHNLGATRCVGVDAAEEFLAHGEQMLRIAGAEDRVELIHSDVFDLPADLEAGFDIVLISVGVLSWLPDLEGFFGVVRSLLKPGGRLVMEEMHPVLFMYEPNAATGVSTIEYSYFTREVWEETDGLDYYGGEVYQSKPNYSFMYRLDDILMAGIDHGLELRSFRELDYDISNFCSDLEHSQAKPPLGFVMVMQLGGG